MSKIIKKRMGHPSVKVRKKLYLCDINNLMTMMKSIENKGITATIALKNEVAGKAQMPEVRRRVVTNR